MLTRSLYRVTVVAATALTLTSACSGSTPQTTRPSGPAAGTTVATAGATTGSAATADPFGGQPVDPNLAPAPTSTENTVTEHPCVDNIAHPGVFEACKTYKEACFGARWLEYQWGSSDNRSKKQLAEYTLGVYFQQPGIYDQIMAQTAKWPSATTVKLPSIYITKVNVSADGSTVQLDTIESWLVTDTVTGAELFRKDSIAYHVALQRTKGVLGFKYIVTLIQ